MLKFLVFSFSALQLFSFSASATTFHWSAGTNEVPNKPPRIYITGPGIATLSDVHDALPNAPLAQIAPALWHLRAELVVEQGAKLVLHGTKIGGDVNELRLQSNNLGDPLHDIIFISADWGHLDIRSTTITSWDDAVNGPDTESGVFRRSYIRARSSLDTNTLAAHESRMDILDSDIGYLGSHNAESYGLVWKVSTPKDGFAPYGALTNLYALVNVYGDIMRSRIHNNYFGMYSFGSYGQRFLDNEMDHNVGYGFDPHDDSDYLTIQGNNVHHNGLHGIIASQRCNNAIIRNNVSWNNARNGIMLHRYCDNSLIEGNRCINNGDAGIALFDNYRTTVRGNTCLRNFTAGIRLSVGPSDNLITDNEFAEGHSYGIYLYKGVDAPFPGDNGHPKRNTFLNNTVRDNAGSGIFLTTADDNLFRGNIFEGNASTMWFINGQRNHFESNSIPRENNLRLRGTPSVLSSCYVKDQPALSIQVDAFSTVTFEDPAGKIFDPEEPGVATTVTTNGAVLTLTTVEIEKTSYVQTRNFRAAPNRGFALVTVVVWNTTGDFSKRWLTQASSSSAGTGGVISYRVGDLKPGVRYRVFKDGVSNNYTADGLGVITFQDTAVVTGVTEFVVME